jgi:hypothetical protein
MINESSIETPGVRRQLSHAVAVPMSDEDMIMCGSALQVTVNCPMLMAMLARPGLVLASEPRSKYVLPCLNHVDGITLFAENKAFGEAVFIRSTFMPACRTVDANRLLSTRHRLNFRSLDFDGFTCTALLAPGHVEIPANNSLPFLVGIGCTTVFLAFCARESMSSVLHGVESGGGGGAGAFGSKV